MDVHGLQEAGASFQAAFRQHTAIESAQKHTQGQLA